MKIAKVTTPSFDNNGCYALMNVDPVSIPEIRGIVGTPMVKQPTIVERHCAVFVNDDKPAPGSIGSFGRRASAAGIRRRHLGAGTCAVTDAQLKDDGALETTLVRDTLISEPLTRREMQIMKSIVAGQTNKEMARTLCRSQRTVEYHRNRLMRKLSAHNSAELVRRAIAMGIV